jgi:hypothetical protein
MGFFKSIKKAFKKIIKGVKKAVKKVVKGVGKVVKKIANSKIFKAIVIAAAIYVTGGAAIGAFSGGTATGFAGSWMTGATNLAAGTGFTATGAAAGTWTAAAQSAAGFLATPFAAAGRALGSAAATVTDFTGLTTEAGRHGVESIAYDPVNQGFLDIKTGKAVTEKSLLDTGLNQAYVDSMKTTGSYINKSGAIVRGGEAIGKPAAKIQGTVTPSTSSLNVKEVVATAAISNAFGLATGVIKDKYFGTDPVGESDSLYLEAKSPLDPIRVYASENNINFGDIYSNPTYGTGDPAYMMNSALFSQDTIGSPTATGATV